jgi:hypothetical protein
MDKYIKLLKKDITADENLRKGFYQSVQRTFIPLLEMGGKNWISKDEAVTQLNNGANSSGRIAVCDKSEALLNVSPNVLVLFHHEQYLPSRKLSTLRVNHRALRMERVWCSEGVLGNYGILGTLMGKDEEKRSITDLEFICCPYVVVEGPVEYADPKEVLEGVFSHERSNANLSHQQVCSYARHITASDTGRLLSLVTNVSSAACEGCSCLEIANTMFTEKQGA